MTQEVWFVSSGEYSSYGVNHVFATEELAEQYVGANDQRGYSESRVEEPREVITELPEPVRVLTKRAYVNKDGLRHKSGGIHTYFPGIDYLPLDLQPMKSQIDRTYLSSSRRELVLDVQGTDHGKVSKVYGEHLRQLIAEFEWYLARPGLKELLED